MGFKKLAGLEVGDHVLSLVWSPDGEQLLVTPSTGLIVRASAAGAVLEELPGHGMGNGVSDFLVTCGFDGRIRLHECGRDVTPGRGWIERVKWSPDRRHLAAAQGRTLWVFDAGGEIAASFPGHQTSVSDFAWNPARPGEIATVCGGGARMWRLGEAEPFARFDWGGASLLVAWSPDGRWIVTGDQTPSVHLYDFQRDDPLHIQGYETKVKAMDFTPDATRLATGGGPMITVWNCTGETGPANTTPGQLRFHKEDVEALAWSPCGQFLASGDVAGRLVFSDVKGRPVSAFQDEEAVSALAWHPDGSRIAVGDAGGRVVIFQKV